MVVDRKCILAKRFSPLFVLKMEAMLFSETLLAKYQTRRLSCSVNYDRTTASPATITVTSADRFAITTPPQVPGCSPSCCAIPRPIDDANTVSTALTEVIRITDREAVGSTLKQCDIPNDNLQLRQHREITVQSRYETDNYGAIAQSI